MKSIFQMELEDKFNRKIKYREKKIENQRKIIGKQQEEIERLNNIINNFEKDIEVIEQIEDIEVMKMQLRNIVFRLKGEDKE